MNIDNEFSEQPTSALLDSIQSNIAGNKYEATQVILKRWRRGIDLEPLINLLQSKNSDDRLLGAYYINELGEPVEGVRLAAMQLAEDPLPHCRQAFVAYMATSGFYDETVSRALAKCLLDLDLYVRATTMKWAIGISREQFGHFSEMVEAGVGFREPKFSNPLSNDFWNDSSLRRAIRGLEIIRHVRQGTKIQQIRRSVTEEDSFVFDSLQFASTRRERLAKNRET